MISEVIKKQFIASTEFWYSIQTSNMFCITKPKLSQNYVITAARKSVTKEQEKLMEDNVFCKSCNKDFLFNDLPSNRPVFCPDCGLDAVKGKNHGRINGNPLGIDYSDGAGAEVQNKRMFRNPKILLLIIVVVIFSVSIGIFLYYSNVIPQQRNRPAILPIVKNKTLTNKTGHALPSQSRGSNNFLTYENSTYGIEIRYPSEWLKLGGSSINQTHTIVHFALRL